MKPTLKQAYKAIPFKQEFYSVLKKNWKPSEPIFKHLYFVGVFKVRVNKTKTFKIKHYRFEIENQIFWSGLTNGWEKESIKLWMKLCENSEIIIDIGANTGLYPLTAKAINPNSKVYAFEPVKRVFMKLRENILLNSFDINPIEKAVSNNDGIAIIYDTNEEHVLSVTVNKNLNPSNIPVIETPVETMTLNSFVRQNNLPKIDLMKIDVETHEPEVLEGFSDYLSKYKPTMLIEILSDEIGTRIHKIVEGLGYLFFNIDEKGRIHRVNLITKSNYYNYLLCSSYTAAKIGLL
ncbi:MAG: FkbM family methyltransferase [Bacteroidia bacterium]|nr:FkbM family methyltransferase [Bacteroidia bacterium]